jgi:capsular polysaccharide biosynthesis protein
MSIEEYKNLKDSDQWVNFFNSSRNFFNITDKLHFVKNAYVTGEDALILDEELNLIDHLLHETYYWSPICLDREYKNPYSNPDILKEALDKRCKHLNEVKNRIFLNPTEGLIKLKSAVYLLHTFGWYAYGHLNDSLLRLKSIESLNLIRDIPILISKPERVVDFELHLEAILGFKPNLIVVQKEQKVFVENLVVPINNSIYTSFIKPDYIWLREKYLEHFKIRELNAKPYKLYLSRNHVTEGTRSVVNQAEVDALLQSHGFITLYGTEPISKIIEYFYYAERVVGYHGSLFSNLSYSKEDCKVLEFCAKNREDHSFQLKYKLIKDYQYHLIDADDKFNAELNLKLIEDFLVNK